MRRAIAALATLVLLVGLASCGGNGVDERTALEEVTAPPPPDAAPPPYDAPFTDPSGQASAAPFEDRSYDEVEAALKEAGLTICEKRDSGGDASGSYEHRAFTVAVERCRIDISASDYRVEGLVIVDLFNSRDTRDEAASTPFGDKIIGYAFGKAVVSVTESSTPEVLERFVQAMTSLSGAVQGYDERG